MASEPESRVAPAEQSASGRSPSTIQTTSPLSAKRAGRRPNHSLTLRRQSRRHRRRPDSNRPLAARGHHLRLRRFASRQPKTLRAGSLALAIAKLLDADQTHDAYQGAIRRVAEVCVDSHQGRYTLSNIRHDDGDPPCTDLGQPKYVLELPKAGRSLLWKALV